MKREFNAEDKHVCEIEGCGAMADAAYFDRVDERVVFACSPHGIFILDRDYPEYHDQCPNCETWHGVN